jgi:DNA-binding NarL/FixJ family response regulator
MLLYKILIVDDSLLIAERLKELLLAIKGVEVSHATDYETAISLLQKELPKIIFLDIQLPGKNGIDILKTIHQKKWNTEVIMLSNQANEYYKKLCRQFGAKRFLDKSADFEAIPELVQTYLQQY